MLQKNHILFIIGGIIFGAGLFIFVIFNDGLTDYSDIATYSVNLRPGESKSVAFELGKRGEWDLSNIHIVMYAEPTNIPILAEIRGQTNLNSISIEKEFQGDFNETIQLDGTDTAILFSLINQGETNAIVNIMLLDGDIQLDDF